MPFKKIKYWAIINFPTKYHWKEKSKYEYIYLGLITFSCFLQNNNIKTISIPALGCGDLDFKTIKQKLLIHKLKFTFMNPLIPITFKLYHGIILEDIDPKNQGRYKVHVPALHQHIKTSEGIWMKNHVHLWRDTSRHNVDPGVPNIAAKNSQDPFSVPSHYGQYFPLQKDTRVLVTFLKNDYSTGEIVKIIADEKPGSLPLSLTPEERDEFYQLFRSPRFSNIIALNEETVTQPKNSFHFYFNKNRTKLIIDENGLHIYTDDNESVTITKDSNKHIIGNSKIEVESDLDTVVHGDQHTHVLGETDFISEEETRVLVGDDFKSADFHLKIKGNCFIETESDTNILTEGDTFVRSLGETHLRSEEELRITSDMDLNIKARNVVLEATNNMNLTAMGDIRLDAANIHLNKDANSKLAIEAIDASTNKTSEKASTNPGYDTFDSTTKELKNV